MISMNEKYQWVAFYEEFADKLYTYADRKDELFEIIREFESKYRYFQYLKLDKKEWWEPRNYTIDPFSVMAVMNRGLTDENRSIIGELYAEIFNISSPVPTMFSGIPSLNNMRSFLGDTENNPLWTLFEVALKYAETKVVTNQLVNAFDNVREIGGNGLAMITIALYWIRPNVFMPLDSISRDYIPERYNIKVPSLTSGGEEYFNFLQNLERVTGNIPFYEISYDAWLDNTKEDDSPEPPELSELTIEDWLDLLNDSSILTDNRKIMLKAFLNHEGKATCTQLANKYGRTTDFYKNSAQHLGEAIVNETGIYAYEENGKHDWLRVLFTVEEAPEEITGSYIWELKPELKAALNQIDLSGYPLYEESNKVMELKPHFRKIQAEDPIYLRLKNRLLKEYNEFEEFIFKTSEDAGNVTINSNKGRSYPRYLVRLGILIEEFYDIKIETFYDSQVLQAMDDLKNNFLDEFNRYNEKEGRFPNAALNAYKDFLKYTRQDFLEEVFLDENEYNTIHQLLEEKQNIILQGAPGVGKTFAAKRLAYSIMGVKDESRIEFIQFHQNYSYEDFVMGYKPDGEGFTLKDGLLAEFCKKAETDSRPYFLIIDEINRGNISKIFGELLMAIEKDYRGVNIKMPYSGETFNVPENLYIIGMMNTADRSLALIDYALRRRFSFYEMKPGFLTDGFVEYQKSLDNRMFDNVIERIEQLNIEIKQDPTLGSGFQIGHSYFTNQTKDSYTDSWLKRVIHYEIIPMLNEYWFDDEEKVSEWQNMLLGVFKDES